MRIGDSCSQKPLSITLPTPNQTIRLLCSISTFPFLSQPAAPFALNHSGFYILACNQLLNEHGQRKTTLTLAIDTFKHLVLDWNIKKFGSIFQKKKTLLARIAGIKKKLDSHHSPHLYNLENNLNRQLDTILREEKSCWDLKSQIEWLVHDNFSIKFLKSSTIHNRKSNRILSIRDFVGNWMVNPQDIHRPFYITINQSFLYLPLKFQDLPFYFLLFGNPPTQ